MPSINDSFVNALLADACYVDINPAIDLSEQLSTRMTPLLAQWIEDNFTVASTINTPDDVVSGAGFDAVVWRGKPNTPFSGQLYVSLRGTEPGADFLTDLNLALTGDAAQQTADMVNWWLRETTPVGQTAPQFAWRLLSATFVSTARAPGTGRFSASDLSTGVFVNGHSLGGFLATTFTRLFGTQANVLQTSTFNSAGFALGSEQVIAALQAQVGAQLGRPQFPGPNDVRQLNYFAMNGLSITTNSLWFSQVGQRIEVFNEFSVGQVPNHYMYKLTDTLALAEAMARLDPSATLARINVALEAGSAAAPADLEGALDGLRRVLQGPLVSATQPADASGSATSRVQFHANLAALRQSSAFASLEGRVRIDVSGISLGAKARGDFSAMASLLAVSPLVLTGTNTFNAVVLQSQLGSVWGQAFTDWQSDRALSVADRQAGRENYTDRWISDRATIVEALVAANARNNGALAYSPLFPADRSFELRWVDGSGAQRLIFAENSARQGGVLTPVPSQLIGFGDDASGALEGSSNQLGDHLYAAGGDDTVRGLAGGDWLEGNAGNDSIDGGAGSDTLLGGAGNDTLAGGEDADDLRGGAGNDAYRFGGRWGTDTIKDSDFLGSIVVDGLGTVSGAGAKLIAPNVWETDDETVRYAYVGANGGQQGYLLISVRGGPANFGEIRIDGWIQGQLGITLGNVAAEAPTADLYVGDFAKTTHTESTQYAIGSGSDFRRYIGGGPQVDAPDVLNGTSGSDSLRGLGGNDGLAGGGGDDTLEGGAGNDLLMGGTGTDSLVGGEGDDVILGSALGSVWTPSVIGQELPVLPSGVVERTRGFSWISYRAPGTRLNGSTATMQFTDVAGANGQIVWDENGTIVIDLAGDLIDGGGGNDYIAAGTGADLVHGGTGDDDIVGLHDADILFGDDGADFIWGDGANANSEPGAPWTNSYTPGEHHGDDILDGGAGNDVLVGQGGGDQVFGGADDDWLYGDDLDDALRGEFHGNDFLDGGSGADQLTGGGRNDVLFGGTGNDSLWGDETSDNLAESFHGRDFLDGEDGADQLVGGGDDDSLLGGQGDDVLLGDDVQSRVDVAAHGDDELDGGIGNDQLVGGGGADTLFGGDGDDQLQGDDLVANVAASAHGGDSLDGGAGNDFVYGFGGDDYVAGGEGNDWLAGEDEATVGASSSLQGADTLVGGAGQDTLVGGNGNDVLEGGTGKDFLAGGAGNDVYLLQAGEGEVVGGLSETIRDSSGSNTVRFGAGVSLAGVQVATAASSQDLLLQYSATDMIYIEGGLGGAIGRFEFSDGTSYSVRELIGRQSAGPVSGTTAGGIFTVMGGSGSDAITTSTAGSSLSGGLGGDSFVSSGGGHTYFYSRGDGHDTIADTRGVDPVSGLPQAAGRIVFGAGIRGGDVRVTSDNGLVLKVGPGTEDSIRLTSFDAQNVLAPLPSIDSFEFFDGTVLTLAQLVAGGFDFEGQSGNESVTGTNLVDRFWASAGNDTLAGGDGADEYRLSSVSGQDVVNDTGASAAGEDVLRVDWASGSTTFLRSGDDLIVRDASGTNRVLVVGHYLGLGIERVEFQDGVIWNRTDIDAHLTSELSEAADTFTGTSGNDIILARGGNDSISGVAGNDTIDGGIGNDTLLGGDGADVLWGMAGADSLLGDAGNDVLDGGADNDTLRGGNDNDSLVGGGGLDVLVGDAGDDLLDGRGDAAADALQGGAGSDTYLFARGSGADNIYDTGETGTTDTVRFDAGIAPTDVSVTSDGDNFTLSFAGSTDTLRLTQTASSAAQRIERIEFADGTVWDDTALRTRYFEGLATSGNDLITGWHISNDSISGGLGIDTLYGLGGDDVLRDGEQMFGGEGSDTYVLTAWTNATVGDSAQSTAHLDTLVLPVDVLPSQVSVVPTSNDDLNLRHNPSGQSIVVSGYFGAQSGGQEIEEIRFADGTVWTPSQLFAARVATTEGNDQNLFAFSWADTVNGLGGDDRIWGRGAGDSLIGGSGNDTLFGDSSSAVGAGDGNDTLDGGVGDDSLYGAGGNDTYRFGRTGGSDTVTEAAGTDRVLLDSGVLTTDVSLFRLGNNLILAIDQGAAQLTVAGHFSGTAGQIESVEFADGTVWNAAEIVTRTVAGTPNAMTGTAGNDVFVVDHDGDTITEAANAGTDTVQSSVQNYVLGANLENLVLNGFLNLNGTGNSLNNAITGNAGRNLLYGGTGADTINGGAGNDTLSGNAVGADDGAVDVLTGGLGDDVYRVNASDIDQIVEAAGGGVDTIELTANGPTYVLPGNVENLIVTSHTYFVSSQLTGNALDNVITGDMSRSGYVLDGGAGADTLLGSALGAIYYVDNVGDRILGTRGDVFSSVNWTLGTGLATLTLTGSGAISGTGNDGNNTLDSRQNFAANVLSGGLGNDTYWLGAGDTVVEQAGAGVDVVRFSGPTNSVYTTFANVESAVLEADVGNSTLVGGLGADSLTGNSSSNVLQGLDGDDWISDQATSQSYDSDVLSGGSGNDTLVSLRGQDTLSGDAGNDLLQVQSVELAVAVNFGAGGGHDRLTSTNANVRVVFDASVDPELLALSRSGADLVATVAGGADSFTVTSFFVDAVSTQPAGRVAQFEFADGIILTASQLVSRLATGNGSVGTSGNDVLIGSGSADTLEGLGGSDTLWGRGGDDVLWAGDGNDTLDGGAGVDDLSGGLGDDSITSGSGADLIRFQRGDGADTISGGHGDTIWFGPGVASTDLTFTASGGDLRIGIVGSTDVITVQGFVDGVNLVDVSFAGGGGLTSTQILDALTTVTGTAGADALMGGSGADRLFGLGGNDTLVGNDGNDTLDGGTGTDSMVGGLGDDVYIVDAATDIVVESASAGTDTVQTTVTLSALAGNVENLVLLGSSALNGTGNTLANLIIGNSAANAINGGSGADTLQGGGGNDTYTVDNTGDVVIELAGEGIDLVNASVNYTLAAEVDNLTFTGTAGLQGTGNALANVLTGNSGANRLTGLGGNDTINGGTGNDTMLGGAGDDTYYVNVSTDVVTEVVGEGVDTIISSVTLTLSSTSDVENLTLGGTSAINGTGNSLANVLTGNSGNNSLTGNAGNDTLNGGAGTDTMVGGAGDDTYYVERTADVVTESANSGTDTVMSSVTLTTLAANVENVTLTGSTALNATANTLDNILTGNSAANTLAGLAGNDTYVGGAGNDILNDNSTTSNDVYRWGIGMGNDAITDAGGSADRIEMDPGVTSSQIVLTRSGNNLQVSITGASDVLTVNGWYTSSANRIEEIRLSDGSTLNLGGMAPLSVVAGSTALAASEPAAPSGGGSGRSYAISRYGFDGDRMSRLLIEAMAQSGSGGPVRDPSLPWRRGEFVGVDLAPPM